MSAEDSDVDIYTVNEIIDYRYNKKKGRDEYRVRWEGYSEAGDTWEPLEHLRSKDIQSDAKALKAMKSSRSRPRLGNVLRNTTSKKSSISPIKKSRSASPARHRALTTKVDLRQTRSSTKKGAFEVLPSRKLRSATNQSLTKGLLSTPNSFSPSKAISSLALNSPSPSKRKSQRLSCSAGNSPSRNIVFKVPLKDGAKRGNKKKNVIAARPAALASPSRKLFVGNSPSHKESVGRRSKSRDSMKSATIISSENDEASDFEEDEEAPLEIARNKLHTSCVPDSLLCRETECEEIRNFIISCLEAEVPEKSLYVSGVPGTGKTACVKKVIQDLLKKRGPKKFVFIELNGLEVSDPKKIFSVLYRQLYNVPRTKAVFASKALSELHTRFSWTPNCAKKDKPSSSVILLVDEVDTLFTKRQDVLYTLFDWSAHPHSRCSIIAISNTLDFPERMCSLKVSSRLGIRRLAFQPYEHEQIEQIILHRLANTGAEIPSETVQLPARKIAALSGDLRKALDLMRRAIDLALEECEENGGNAFDAKLSLTHVNKAIAESTTSVRMEYCLSMFGHEEAMFRALVKDLKLQGIGDTLFYHLLDRYRVECYEGKCVTDKSFEPLNCTAAFGLLLDMSEYHMVVLGPEHGVLNRHVSLGFPLSEAEFCIRQMDNERKKQKEQQEKRLNS